ncbi:MAG: hypothetical protein EPN73_12175 [Paraburkholderia sp.]|uniref:hypothetical protein n=1 Tax=Paraburkholderia sp. TaxID=1926495 RepID=UPI00121BC19F|nr:hypothetical protein [Paraburkholderia sp.]TAL95798.1 MAG: hypothetical protein EPN73_12175 [Paraburkholderia sp.]
MNWKKTLAAERTITIVGSIAVGSSGVYAFIAAGLCRIMFDLDENMALLWIGIPLFVVLLIVHICLLPKHLRKAGLIK